LVVPLVLVLLFLVGLILLAAGSEKWGASLPYVGHLLPEVLRDLGISFIVSCVVASLFELYRSVRHQIDTMRDVIDLVMGEQITPEVWIELKELIARKQMIRQDARIRLELQPHSSLQPHHAVLRVEYDYELHGLTNKRSKVTVRHELDYHLTNESLKLPRFESIVVDTGSTKDRPRSREFARTINSGRLVFDVELPPRGSRPLYIRTERYEIVNLPGSYNLYMPEFTKGLRLNMIGCPNDIEAEVLVRPQGGGQILKKMDNTWSCEQLIFPGQGIEVKFLSRPQLEKVNLDVPQDLDSAEPSDPMQSPT
jgi:hypothetical protein